jgi:hypothetical protein
MMREPKCLHKGLRAISVTDFILGSIYDIFNVKSAFIDGPNGDRVQNPLAGQ